MAVNAYLIIDGRPGPSTSKAGAIDILSFSFGASQTAVIGVGSSGGEARAGRANLLDGIDANTGLRGVVTDVKIRSKSRMQVPICLDAFPLARDAVRLRAAEGGQQANTERDPKHWCECVQRRTAV